MTPELPSPEILRKLLRYEPETGKLFWRERERSMFACDRSHRTWNTRYANQQAFTTINQTGYKTSTILFKTCKAHRVIWAIQTGAWPNGDIDHIDRNKTNNTWSNLRAASRSENLANRKSKKDSSSTFLGVSWYERDKKWRAKISKNNCKKHLGYFDSEIEAAKAYDVAAKNIHGIFSSLNFP